jgi:hypothetical protein
VINDHSRRTGGTEEASIASGSTTTRLLGTFQQVEHVLLVGVGGGVPHYTDYTRHVRLGDVVLAAASAGAAARFIYQQCDSARVSRGHSLYTPAFLGGGVCILVYM